MFFLSNLFDSSMNTKAKRRFVPRDEITAQLKQKNSTEIFRPGCELIIFDTSRQHTWLIISDSRLYCVIDNLNDDGAKISWTADLSQLSHGGIENNIFAQDPGGNFGLISILDKKVRKFSKSLYTADELKQKITQLIREASAATQPTLRSLRRAEHELV